MEEEKAREDAQRAEERMKAAEEKAQSDALREIERKKADDAQQVEEDRNIPYIHQVKICDFDHGCL